jgi:predicted nucleotide-binding protein
MPQKKLNRNELNRAILRIQKCAEELEVFSPNTVTHAGDISARAIESKINMALEDIFGCRSPEYYKFSTHLNTASVRLDKRTPIDEVINGYVKGKNESIIKLKSLIEVLEERLEFGEIDTEIVHRDSQHDTNRVFIVHGRDHGLKSQVSRYLSQIGLTPIILHEMPSGSKTLIEKMESCKDVGFAVVLMTADDRGASKDVIYEKQKLRPRQNVILELGYFIGSLGRERVCTLYEDEVEIPSDYSGVVFIPISDKEDGWKILLVRELKKAGMAINMDNVA